MRKRPIAPARGTVDCPLADEGRARQARDPERSCAAGLRARRRLAGEPAGRGRRARQEQRAHHRARAARQPRELPASYVLGIGEAAETLLERVRLVSLSARVDADGRVRRAEVYLADPAAGTIGVVRQSWHYEQDATPESGPELAQRTVLPRLDLGTLAHGNVVSRAVRRRASGELLLGTTAAQTTLLPGSADFSALPTSLLVRRVRELRARQAAAPPACLRPRLLAEGLIVFAVAEVAGVSYAAAEQTAQAIVRDEEGEPLIISVSHRAVAPYAVEAFAAALVHVFNHATHHRGQITAAVTTLGHRCPVLDMVFMLQQEAVAAVPQENR